VRPNPASGPYEPLRPPDLAHQAEAVGVGNWLGATGPDWPVAGPGP
jgi:hypothetical protein